MGEPERQGSLTSCSKTGVVIGLSTFVVILLACCCCFFFVQGRKYKDEQSTGEVYILQDEVVETGYIHSERNDNNY